jgi:hypothetical protein
MTAETTQTIAGILAQRLGVERSLIEGTLADQPLAAAMAISLLQRPTPETCDPAQTVRFVATLVGACPVCLGEDRICHECGGRGGPGSRDPDAAALVAWITPPLRRLGLCVGRPRRAAPDTTTKEHES